MWEAWACKFGINVLPASEKDVALFLIHLGSSTVSAANVRLALPAIVWGHRFKGIENNLDSQFLKDISCGLRRLYAKPRQPKEPFSAENLKKVVDTSDLENLRHLRCATMMVLAFAGFLRFDELRSLKWSDIIFEKGYVTLVIRKSKTDQLREGDRVLIAQALSKACAVSLLKKYLLLSEARLDSDVFVFRALTNNNKTRPTNLQMSYTSVRDVMKRKFIEIGLDHNKFGIHSLRAGGATSAANRGIPDRLFKRHGRWSSDSAKDSYVKDSVVNMLRVSQSLGL